MNRMHGTVAQVRVISRCALTGVLAAMLATQSFAQGATGDSSTPTTPAATTLADNNSATLPDAPVASTSASAEPASAMKADEATSSAVTSTTPKKHKVKAGWLALGIAGGASLAMGTYIYSLNARNTSAKMTLGSMFAVPGAAAAGFGFYFAFK